MSRGLSIAAAALLLFAAGCESAGERTADVSAEVEAYAPPPPPPAAAAPYDTAAVEELTAEAPRSVASEADAAARNPRADTEAIAPPAPPRRRERMQSGVLTAADHDDLLNPGLYADFVSRFVREYGGVDAPQLDTARRVTIVARGAGGAPVQGARVQLRRQDGSLLDRTTAANGELVLHPALDGLPERVEAVVTGPNGGPGVRRAFAVTPARRPTTVSVELPGSGVRARQLDLLLAVDTTGSMGDELEFLKAELADIVAAVAQDNPGVETRLGLIVYRDDGDQYVVRSFPFTGDVRALQNALDRQSAGGGGDYPEAVDQALEAALQYDWRPRAVKALVHVADAPPHDDRAMATWRHAMALRGQGVHIVPVAASGVGPAAEYLMRAMAAATQSRYLFLTDDSGVGLPHGEPAVDCYQVTRLDGLLRRVLSGLVAGRRIEAAPAEVIREVGDYDRGVCRLPGQRDAYQQ